MATAASEDGDRTRGISGEHYGTGSPTGAQGEEAPQEGETGEEGGAKASGGLFGAWGSFSLRIKDGLRSFSSQAKETTKASARTLKVAKRHIKERVSPRMERTVDPELLRKVCTVGPWRRMGAAVKPLCRPGL